MAHFFTLFVDGCAQVKLPKWEVPTSVAAGKSHSLALTVYGELYAWGKGWCGELGVAPNDPVVKMPMKASAALTAGSSPSLPSASGGGSSSRNTLGKSGCYNSSQCHTHTRACMQMPVVGLLLPDCHACTCDVWVPGPIGLTIG